MTEKKLHQAQQIKNQQYRLKEKFEELSSLIEICRNTIQQDNIYIDVSTDKIKSSSSLYCVTQHKMFFKFLEAELKELQRLNLEYKLEFGLL